MSTVIPLSTPSLHFRLYYLRLRVSPHWLLLIIGQQEDRRDTGGHRAACLQLLMPVISCPAQPSRCMRLFKNFLVFFAALVFWRHWALVSAVDNAFVSHSSGSGSGFQVTGFVSAASQSKQTEGCYFDAAHGPLVSATPVFLRIRQACLSALRAPG